MSKVNQQLHIDDYTKEKNIIWVSAIHGGKDVDVPIETAHYERWLRQSGKLDGCMDYYDAAEVDRHGQIEYTITPEEYWDVTDFRDICEDLAMYIMRHDLLGDAFDMFGQLGKILKNQPDPSPVNPLFQHINKKHFGI